MDTPTGAEYIKIKEEMFSEGILSFQDAYDLVFRYIWEKSLNFSRFSDKRFKCLFIDEVQDCDNQQVALIQKIFDENKVVIQRLGDYCQAIYEKDESSGPENDRLKDGKYYIYATATASEKKSPNRCGHYVLRIIINL